MEYTITTAKLHKLQNYKSINEMDNVCENIQAAGQETEQNFIKDLEVGKNVFTI